MSPIFCKTVFVVDGQSDKYIAGIVYIYSIVCSTYNTCNMYVKTSLYKHAPVRNSHNIILLLNTKSWELNYMYVVPVFLRPRLKSLLNSIYSYLCLTIDMFVYICYIYMYDYTGSRDFSGFFWCKCNSNFINSYTFP